jgi:PleD family two-component response regulator
VPAIAQALVDEADKALYRAKHLGRDRAVHYRDMEGAR